jgi:hypothetical protein
MLLVVHTKEEQKIFLSRKEIDLLTVEEEQLRLKD